MYYDAIQLTEGHQMLLKLFGNRGLPERLDTPEPEGFALRAAYASSCKKAQLHQTHYAISLCTFVGDACRHLGRICDV